MDRTLTIKTLKPEAVAPYIPDIVKLRIEIFKDYPYLYVGDIEYETKALQNYFSCPKSIAVLAFAGEKVVGVSTGLPLEYETAEFRRVFVEHGMNPADIYYLSESILLTDYRGKNFYHLFFQDREAVAFEYGYQYATFCTIERSLNEAGEPEGYAPLEKIWRHLGYKKHPELFVNFEWKEVGTQTVLGKTLTFWLKKL